jgi:hypothetical protein
VLKDTTKALRWKIEKKKFMKKSEWKFVGLEFDPKV